MTRAQPLSPPLARFVVLAPTVLLSLALGSHGYPLGPRIAACVGVGAVLITLVAWYQRRHMT